MEMERPWAKPRRKTFGLPDSHGLDRNTRTRLMVFARAWSARHRAPGQHKGPITRAFLEVLWALLDFANTRTGSCFPGYEAVAAKAKCARSTVGQAIRVLEWAGVITVVNRLRRVGPRVFRTSNAYLFRAMAPSSENRAGTQTLKESSFLPASAGGPTRYIVLDPRSPLDAALAKLGRQGGFIADG